MSRKSRKKPYYRVSLPAIDGEMRDPTKTYYTRNTRVDENTILSKEKMKVIFKNRFGYDPEEIFYGKPNGSLIYAGPLTRTPSPREELPATFPENLQPTLF